MAVIGDMNEYNTLVSVVIITFNQEKTISQTIESILHQKCTISYEIVIGEDCGTDNTRSICIAYQQKHLDKIKLILFEKNGGVVANWTNCVKVARGKYITSCAGDDYWHNPDKLQLQIEYMESHPNCGILHTDFDELNTNSKKVFHSVIKKQKKEILQGFRQKEIFNGSLPIVAPTVCFRKELFDKYIPVNKYIELNFPIEDWPTWVILSKYSEINFLPISTVTYRKGAESISNPLHYEKIKERFDAEHLMYKFLCNMFPDELTYNENEYLKYVNDILLNLAYKKSDYLSAKKYAQKLIDLGSNKVRVKMSQFWLTFKIFAILKKFRQKIHDQKVLNP